MADTEFSAVVGTKPRPRRGNETESVPCTASNQPTPARPDASQWSVSGDTYRPCSSVTSKLPSGSYCIEIDPMQGLIFVKQKIFIDDLIEFPDSASNEVIQQVEAFWDSESRFRNYGFLWKRGVLLWGPPGCVTGDTMIKVRKKSEEGKHKIYEE